MRQGNDVVRLRAVHDVWQVLTEDADERRAFATLTATLHLPSQPAGPRNRRRHVVRIDLAGQRYYCKQFTSTQWKNRVTFCVTAPRAHDDAERELRVTEALRAAGFAAPRPVAYGRRGAAAFYVCAELAGESLLDCARRGFDAAIAYAAARHCGALLATGYWLPDLGADHVFVAGHGAGRAFAVLDLHNGRLGAAGTVPHRVLVRVLRRFRRSSRDLQFGWPIARAFALRLLRAAGCRGEAARAVLRALPPWSTAARYEAPGKSTAYERRNPARAERELTLLQRVWPGRTGETVLDLPCGAGRLLPLLRDTLGHGVLQADGALAMLQQARAAAVAAVPGVRADALAMPFPDRAVDGVVMFRFLHHLDGDAARAAIAEACRVARRFVVVSFFHPCSTHHLQRRLRQWIGGPTTRHAVSLRGMQARFAPHDFRLHAHTAELPYVRDLWLAAFVRGSSLASTAQSP